MAAHPTLRPQRCEDLLLDPALDECEEPLAQMAVLSAQGLKARFSRRHTLCQVQPAPSSAGSNGGSNETKVLDV